MAAGIVIVWAVSGPIFGFSDTWQLVINTGTTIVTFLMVFLIQNSQNRDSAAIQVKLDELIRVGAARNSMVGIEHLTDDELEDLRGKCEARARAEKAADKTVNKTRKSARRAADKVANRCIRPWALGQRGPSPKTLTRSCALKSRMKRSWRYITACFTGLAGSSALSGLSSFSAYSYSPESFSITSFRITPLTNIRSCCLRRSWRSKPYS